MPDAYDAIVIGSGTAGQTAAYDLAKEGLNVAVVEHSDRPGGTCALSGCQAKKWFYEGTETVARSRHLTGIGIEKPAHASWVALRDAKNRFTSRVPQGTVDGINDAGIDFISGWARFSDDRSIAVENRRYAARFFVVATGAVPTTLPFNGSQHLVSSSAFMELDRLPGRIAFVGGGFISFEFAHFAVRLGSPGTRCTILEAGSRPLVPFDPEMVGLLQEASAQEAIDVHCDVTITAVGKIGSGFTIKLKGAESLECDMVVHGAGRAACIEGLDLEKAGVAYTDKGITVDDRMATSNSRVYAVGDCTDTIKLARVADAEAQTAAANIVSRHKGNDHETFMDYTAVPVLLFSYPQYGMVGATEDSLKDDGIAYEKSVGKKLNWPTYKRVGIESAAFKILVGKTDRRILGAHILSDNATGLINTFTLAMHNRIPVGELHRQSVMTPYPSRESDIIYMLNPLL